MSEQKTHKTRKGVQTIKNLMALGSKLSGESMCCQAWEYGLCNQPVLMPWHFRIFQK